MNMIYLCTLFMTTRMVYPPTTHINLFFPGAKGLFVHSCGEQPAQEVLMGLRFAFFQLCLAGLPPMLQDANFTSDSNKRVGGSGKRI